MERAEFRNIFHFYTIQLHGSIASLIKCSVITQPEDVQAIFSDSDKHSKASNNDAGWLMEELLGKCLDLISGQAWQNALAVTAAPFTHKASREYVTLIFKATEDYFKILEKPGNLKNGFINPIDDLRLLPFWVVIEILYGKLSTPQREEFINIIPIRELLFKRMI